MEVLYLMFGFHAVYLSPSTLRAEWGYIEVLVLDILLSCRIHFAFYSSAARL